MSASVSTSSACATASWRSTAAAEAPSRRSPRRAAGVGASRERNSAASAPATADGASPSSDGSSAPHEPPSIAARTLQKSSVSGAVTSSRLTIWIQRRWRRTSRRSGKARRRRRSSASTRETKARGRVEHGRFGRRSGAQPRRRSQSLRHPPRRLAQRLEEPAAVDSVAGDHPGLVARGEPDREPFLAPDAESRALAARRQHHLLGALEEGFDQVRRIVGHLRQAARERRGVRFQERHGGIVASRRCERAAIGGAADRRGGGAQLTAIGSRAGRPWHPPRPCDRQTRLASSCRRPPRRRPTARAHGGTHELDANQIRRPRPPPRRLAPGRWGRAHPAPARRRQAHRARARRPAGRRRHLRRGRPAGGPPLPRLQHAARAHPGRRRRVRLRRHRRAPGLRVRAGLHGGRRHPVRDQRQEDLQDHGPGDGERRAGDRVERQRRRAHPGRRRFARRLRRHLPAQHARLGRHPADQRDHGPLRRRRGLLARDHRLRVHGQGHLATCSSPVPR